MAAIFPWVPRDDDDAYKYQWSRHVARQSLDRDVKLLKHQISQINPANLSGSLGDVMAEALSDGEVTNQELRDIAKRVPSLTFGKSPEKPGQFKMGIIGSGVAGLFTAMLIDTLNERFKDKLNITYDILEASEPERLGGRLYTYHFPKVPEGVKDPNEKDPKDPKIRRNHQYYDIGAMRFPENKVMSRTFKLFNLLDMKRDGPDPDLIPYYYFDDDEVCPSYYNDKRVWGPPKFKKHDKDSMGNEEETDVFGVNQWLPPDDPNRIPKDVIEYSPSETVDLAIVKFTDRLQDDLDHIQAKLDSNVGEPDPGWDLLNKADFMSARQFLRSTTIPELANQGIVGPGYNFNTIEWLETYSLATGWYNQALSEVLLETLDFGPPKDKPDDKHYFWCIDGGTQQLAKKMAAKLTKQPEFNKQVTAIVQDLKDKGDITLKIKSSQASGTTTESRSYFTVFNATTLGALQRMDLSKADLLYGTKQAIRSLSYGASCKVGIQFKTMWWMKDPWKINKGGLGKTDLPLRVCVYPSYNIGDDKDKPGVLLCSYSWAQDAQRIGTLIDPKSPSNEMELKELMLSNLAQLHAYPEKGWPYEKLLEHLRRQYITHHAYDWYHDANMAGAFAWFGPGQFSQMWPEIIKPSGWLFLVGEAASAHHGWIVGALESAVRAMYQLLHLLQDQIEKEEKHFDGYLLAMKFLIGPENKADPDWKLPFVGLPREIPFKQLGSSRDRNVQETPVEDDVDLSFIAAQCIASFLEMMVQLEKEKATTKA